MKRIKAKRTIGRKCEGNNKGNRVVTKREKEGGKEENDERRI